MELFAGQPANEASSKKKKKKVDPTGQSLQWARLPSPRGLEHLLHICLGCLIIPNMVILKIILVTTKLGTSANVCLAAGLWESVDTAGSRYLPKPLNYRLSFWGTKGGLLIWIAKKCCFFFFICGSPQWNVGAGVAPHPAVALSNVNLNYDTCVATDLKTSRTAGLFTSSQIFQHFTCFFFLFSFF